MANKKILKVLAILLSGGLILGVINVVKGNFSGIAYPLVPFQIYIWGDTLVIIPFLLLGLFWLIKKNNPAHTGLFFSTYFTLRSFIEIIYSLNAQFSNSTRAWERSWDSLEIVTKLGKTEVFVLAQLFYTALTIFSFMAVLYFSRKYFKQ